MLNLLQKTYNCYIILLNNINFGKTDGKYDIIYWSTLFLRSEIDNPAIVEYFKNNLKCNG